MYVNYNIATLLCGLIKKYPLKNLFRTGIFIENSLKNFFIYVILPKLIGKRYTGKPIADGSGIVSV